MGDSIYWTRNRVQLKRGELLLTDGKRYARTRCGNRISEEPQRPVAQAEPTADRLDTPEWAENVPAAQVTAELLGPGVTDPPPDPEVPASAPPITQQGANLPVGAVQGVPIPPGPGPVSAPIVETPEPGTFVLMLAGLVVAGGIRAWRSWGRPGGPRGSSRTRSSPVG